MTSYAAIVARELDIPMVSDAQIPGHVADGDVITLDAERGVIYEDAIGERRRPRIGSKAGRRVAYSVR